MGESSLLSLPSQAESGPSEEAALAERRRRRARVLVPTVRRVHGGFRVASARQKINYLVTRADGQPLCTCLDFLYHEEEPGFQCKHILAVDMARRQGLVADADPISIEPLSAGRLAVEHRYIPREDPVRIKLTRNTRGYCWEVAVAEKDSQKALEAVRDLEQKLRDAFGEKQ